MRYSSYPVWKEPRSFRAGLGGLLSLLAILFGAFYATPQLQRSLVMQAVPQPLSWHELVRDGLGNNAFVELADVAVAPDDERWVAIEDQLREFQRESGQASKRERLQSLLDEVGPKSLLEYATAPLKVIPRGADPQRVPPQVLMSRLGPSLARAHEQLESESTLTGYVRPAVDATWLNKQLEALGVIPPTPQVLAEKTYVISATRQVPTRSTAIAMLGASVLTGAMGLVIAGSGAPSLWMCLLAPLPCLFSVLGYPLRYGRASATNCLVYTVVGAALIAGGGYVARYTGGLSQVDGDALLQSLSFVAITFGTAAVAGARLSSRVGSPMYETVSAQLFKQPETDFRIQRLIPTAAAVETVADNKYLDPRLSDASDAELTEAMEEQIASLEAGGFDSPKQIYVHEESRRRLTTLSLGCQGMVVCEIGQSGQASLTRLVSVLSDGLVVITLSANTPHVSSLRVGENGVYLRARGDAPADMLSEHLDRTAGIAEERHAQVLPIDAYEKLDVFLIARRVLSDVQHEYDEVPIIADKATYGRFAFPCRRVEMLVAR